MVKSKKFLRVVSALCTASVAATLLCAAPVSAATRLKGDVNNDGRVNISDVTEIQRYLVGFKTLDSASLTAADVNFDGTVNIADATEIQRYLVDYITGFNGLKDTKWTSLSTTSTKTIRFQTASPQANVKVTVPAAAKRWLTATPVVSNGKVKEIKLTTKTYTSTLKARSTTIKINLEGNTYNFTVKQLPKGTGEYKDACYAYAMQWEVDPRSDTRVFLDTAKNHVDPGELTGIAEYSRYDGDSITYLKSNSYLSDFTSYTIDRVKADLATMGWGIKKKTSAKAKVKEGDWLVCLVFNPAECIRDEEESVNLFLGTGGPVVSADYHWYRREDNSDGSFTWSHKPGTTKKKTLAKNKTPQDYDAETNPYILLTNPIDYNRAMANYVTAYRNAKHQYDIGNYYIDPEEFDSDKFYFNYSPKDKNEINMLDSFYQMYFFIGYYEVGPNAL